MKLQLKPSIYRKISAIGIVAKLIKGITFNKVLANINCHIKQYIPPSHRYQFSNLNIMENWLRSFDINVKSYESDFSNGYLIGSILNKHNLINDFESFMNTAQASYSNLIKVQSALDRLGISFDPYKLLNKDPRYAQKLMRAIQAHLQLSSGYPRLSKTEIFSKHSERFAVQNLKQSHQAYLSHMDQIEEERQLIGESQKKQIDSLKKNKKFMLQWESEGKKNWRKNQSIKIARENLHNDIKSKIVNDFKDKTMRLHKSVTNETYNGIDDFEKKMIRLGIGHEQPKRKRSTSKQKQ